MEAASTPPGPAPISDLVHQMIVADAVAPGTRLGKLVVPVGPAERGTGIAIAPLPVGPSEDRGSGRRLLAGLIIGLLLLGTLGLIFEVGRRLVSADPSTSDRVVADGGPSAGSAPLGSTPSRCATTDATCADTSTGTTRIDQTDACPAAASGCPSGETTSTACPVGVIDCLASSTTIAGSSTTQCPAGTPGCTISSTTTDTLVTTTRPCPPGLPGCGPTTSTVTATTSTTQCLPGTPGCGPPTTTTTAPPCVPALTSISPTSGPSGQVIVITGCGFTGATRVTFSNVTTGQVLDAASFTVVSDTRIRATAPSFPVGAPFQYDINVVTPRGTTASVAVGRFQST